jgi:spermidine dehydrogenase
MTRPITRRDFLNGARVTVAGSVLAPELAAALEALAQDAPYPPALTGMRGSHEGSYEVAHRLRDQGRWTGVVSETRETYDLVVVGAGLSGLAAAYSFRKTAGPSARILLLDNHDDFGGHAKRNEFRHGGRLLIGYGGTEQIYPGPSAFGPEARALLAEIGVETDRFYTAFDQKFYSSLGLEQALFFDRETFGADRLVTGEGRLPWAEFLKRTPLSEGARADIERLYERDLDYLPSLSFDEKRARLARMSYNDFLLNVARVVPDVLPYFQTRPHRLGAIGSDARSALAAWRSGLPGFRGLGLGSPPESSSHEPHDIFHFPDGNASLARLFARSLVPHAVPGRDMEDVVTSRVDYGLLDEPSSNVRIRLESTAVAVTHAGDPESAREVEVTYVRGGSAYRVKASHSVLACYNAIVPYLCPEMPEAQRKALSFAVRAPLVYTNVLVSNWRPWQKLGVHHILALNGYHTEAKLDFPVSLGGYRHPATPDEPIVLHLEKTPLSPGLPRREQHRAGRTELLSTPFATFEIAIRDQLGRMLGAGGFDPAREVEAITVNRWPHGYATGRDPLTDPEWPEGEDPWSLARKPFGRIALASSDSGPGALTQVAFDQALRAVRELDRT